MSGSSSRRGSSPLPCPMASPPPLSPAHCPPTAARGLMQCCRAPDQHPTGPRPGGRRPRTNPALPDDPDLLPGPADVAAPDAPGSGADTAGTGYLWDAALRAHLTVRNYGFYG